MLYDNYICDKKDIIFNEYEESYEIPNYDGARISKLVPPGKLLRNQYEDAKTLIEVLERGSRISENALCIGWRSSKSEYSWLNYNDFLDRAKNFGSGLINLGIQLGQLNKISIYAQNSVEWLVAQYGCCYHSSPIVPLYDTIGSDARSFMINNAEIQVVICDEEEKVKALLDHKGQTPSLKWIIHVNSITKETENIGANYGIKMKLFSDVEELGKISSVPINVPQPTDTMMICYTSGTTGNPKGCVVTHRSLIAGMSGLIEAAGELVPNKNDVSISYLPLAHIYEQVLQVYIFVHGGRIGFFGGNIPMLTDDMRVLRPTIFPTVPRVLNKMYDKMNALLKKLQTESIGKCIVSEGATNGIESNTKNDKLIVQSSITKPILDILGGNIRFIISGAAPLSERVLTFFLEDLNFKILEVYGQTECSGPACVNVVTPETIGSIGPPLLCNMIKLEDVPELGYFKTQNIGEVCIKGPNVFKGYLKDPKQTSEAIDEDGWLHTGDVGEWLPNGTLKIVDRKKQIFKLAQGEYIMPEQIENVYLISSYVSQIFVHGDSLQSFLVAIVIPEQSEVMTWCKKMSISGTWIEICSNKIVKQHIIDEMQRVAKSAGLLSFQQVKDIYLHPSSLTIQDGHLTPTQKIKRDIIRKYFFHQIRAMYANSN